ncbi:adenylate/guanylate cyclase domain-containing protein [Longimicrobium sp.]|jgi:adenylate cyclase|uniref:CHASE2 domain-containing protein n=1 Tax=Longimicrobium sp. TaxID=2029185 RepID=UPI002EDA2F5C
MKLNLPQRRTLLLAAVALLAPLLALAVAEARVGRALERRVYDSWFTMRGTLPRPADVVIVAIDTDSEASLGRYPWGREWHARLLRNLHRAGARVVAFDLTFADAFPRADTAFRAAIDETGIAVLGAKTDVVLRRGARGFRLEEPAGVLRGAAMGIVDVQPDAVDGVVREYPLLHAYPDRAVPQLGAQAVLRFLGLPANSLRQTVDGWRLAARAVPAGPGGAMLVDWAGPAGSVSTYSYATVVDDAATDLGEWDLDSFEDLARDGVFRGRIVLVGTTVPEHQDLHPTPVRDADGAAGAVGMPGVEIHAQAAAALLAGRHVRPVPRPAQYAWAVLLAAAAVLALSRLRGWRGVAAAGALAVLAPVAAGLLFTGGAWLWTVAPLLAVGLASGGSAAVLWADEARERARIRGMFQQYVPPAVVRELIRRPELLALGGEERVATVLFSDVRGFSAVAERLAPAELVALLNEYLTAMTDVVVRHGGIVDKYIGDCLMAEFGVPVPLDDHPVHACRAALRMRDELRRLRADWRGRGLPALHARTGINTGEVLVGNLGSHLMMDYTCMGDHVNLASRLEGLNKDYGTEIVVSEFTWAQVQAHFIGREIDCVRVVGREGLVSVHELVATREDGVDADTAALLDGFAHARTLYCERRFSEALDAFQALVDRFPEDGPAAVYLERCHGHAAAPPPAEWDGAHQLVSK